MKSKNKILGTEGENIAATYLLQRGFTLLEKNYRYQRWEIDIIAQKHQILHFIEVKTRSSLRFGYPEQGVDALKMAHIKNVAEQYLYEKKCSDVWVQYDIIAIVLSANAPPIIDFFEDVF